MPFKARGSAGTMLGYRVWGGGLEPRAWRAREREPITGVWGSRDRAPGRGSGERSTPEAENVLIFSGPQKSHFRGPKCFSTAISVKKHLQIAS